jgi:hypothetical protein
MSNLSCGKKPVLGLAAVIACFPHFNGKRTEKTTRDAPIH